MSRFFPSDELLHHLRPAFVDQDNSVVPPTISNDDVGGSMRNVLPILSAHLMNKLTLDVLELPLPEYRTDSLGNDVTLSRIKYLSYNLFSKNNWDNSFYIKLLSFTCKVYGCNIIRDKEASVSLQEIAYFSLECIRSLLYHLIDEHPNKPKHGFTTIVRFHEWLNDLHPSLFNLVYTESEEGNREYYEDTFALNTYLGIYNDYFKEVDFLIHQDCGLIKSNPNSNNIALNYASNASKMIEYFFHRGLDEIKFNTHEWNLRYGSEFINHRNSYIPYYPDLPFGIPVCQVNYDTPFYGIIGTNDLQFDKTTSVLHSPNFTGFNFNEVNEDLINPYLKIKREYEQNMVNRENPIRFKSVSTIEDIYNLDVPDEEKVMLINKLSDLETFGVDTTDPNYATDKDFFRRREPIMNTYRVDMMEDLPGLDFIPTTDPHNENDGVWEEITNLLLDDSSTINEVTNIKEIDMTVNSPDVVVDDREVIFEGGKVEPKNSNWLKAKIINVDPNSGCLNPFGRDTSLNFNKVTPEVTPEIVPEVVPESATKPNKLPGMRAFVNKITEVDPSSLPKKCKVSLDLTKLKSEVGTKEEPKVVAPVSEDKHGWEDVSIENVEKHFKSRNNRFNNLILNLIKDEKSQVHLFINELVESLVNEKLSNPVVKADIAIRANRSKSAIVEELSIDVDTNTTTGGFYMSDAVIITDVDDDEDMEFDNAEPAVKPLTLKETIRENELKQFISPYNLKDSELLNVKTESVLNANPTQVTEKKFDKILVGKDGVRLGHLELSKKIDFIPVDSNGNKIPAKDCVYATMYLGKMLRILYSSNPDDVGLEVELELDGKVYRDPRKILHLNDGFDSKLIPTLIPAKNSNGGVIPNSYVANGKFSLCNDLGYMYRRNKDGSLYLMPDRALTDSDRFIYDYKTERFFVNDIKGHRLVEGVSIYNSIFGVTYNPMLLPDGDARKEIDYIPNSNFHSNIVNLYNFPKHVFKSEEIEKEIVTQPVVNGRVNGLVNNRSNSGLVNNSPKTFIVNNGSGAVIHSEENKKEDIRTVNKLSDLKISSVNLNDLKADLVFRDMDYVSFNDCIVSNRKRQNLVIESGINLEYSTLNNVTVYKIDDPSNVIAIDAFNDCTSYDSLLALMNDVHEKIGKRNDEYAARNMSYVNGLNSLLTAKTNQYLKLNVSPGISIDDFREDFLDLFDYFKNHKSSFISENYERHMSGLTNFINGTLQLNVGLNIQGVDLKGADKFKFIFIAERFIYTDKSSNDLNLNSLSPRGAYLENVNFELYKDLVDVYGRLKLLTSTDAVVHFVTSDNVIYEIGVVDNVTVPFSNKNVKNFYIKKR